jgi:hypothetical protein
MADYHICQEAGMPTIAIRETMDVDKSVLEPDG